MFRIRLEGSPVVTGQWFSVVGSGRDRGPDRRVVDDHPRAAGQEGRDVGPGGGLPGRAAGARRGDPAAWWAGDSRRGVFRGRRRESGVLAVTWGRGRQVGAGGVDARHHHGLPGRRHRGRGRDVVGETVSRRGGGGLDRGRVRDGAFRCFRCRWWGRFTWGGSDR